MIGKIEVFGPHETWGWTVCPEGHAHFWLVAPGGVAQGVFMQEGSMTDAHIFPPGGLSPTEAIAFTALLREGPIPECRRDLAASPEEAP